MIEMRMDGRCALITGGSMGIGYAAATNFMQAGASVAIVARRPEVLEESRQKLAREGNGKVAGPAPPHLGQDRLPRLRRVRRTVLDRDTSPTDRIGACDGDRGHRAPERPSDVHGTARRHFGATLRVPSFARPSSSGARVTVDRPASPADRHHRCR